VPGGVEEGLEGERVGRCEGSVGGEGGWGEGSDTEGKEAAETDAGEMNGGGGVFGCEVVY